jgi:hypothetical protein
MEKLSKGQGPILITEIGWPSGGTGSEEEQKAFIERMPALLKPCDPAMVIWALLHDFIHPAFNADLRSIGVITNDGTEKLGYGALLKLAESNR